MEKNIPGAGVGVAHCGWEVSVGSQSLGTVGSQATWMKVPGVPAQPLQNCHIFHIAWAPDLLPTHPAA